ncbi:choline kinase [Mesorhizobium sp. USDA 4775]|uniref:NTP transferase domain-containing protein n=1 Tax=Mesorhizobium jarvisii TaxID=1777867 RepID=UPI001F0A9B66|nr:NTP transferase domain-containing protein [Mesorhizobium jarvisii]MCH4561194.1 NTP transferase domain-containing protein [Mesorhizobium jarvisii]
MPIKTAVILAAGLGTRLGDITKHSPKALVKVWGEPLIVRLCNQLVDAGIEEIVVVVGYMRSNIMSTLGAAHRGTPITYLESDNFASTNNVTSLAKAASYRRPFLLCDCDVLLESLPAEWLVEHGRGLGVPVRMLGVDEVGTVMRLIEGERWEMRVKRRGDPSHDGEMKSLSIYAIYESSLASTLLDRCVAAVQNNEINIYYEDILSRILPDFTAAAIDVDAAGLRSFEIDTPLDLAEAEEFLSVRTIQPAAISAGGRTR